jgi:hypothetical protein
MAKDMSWAVAPPDPYGFLDSEKWEEFVEFRRPDTEPLARFWQLGSYQWREFAIWQMEQPAAGHASVFQNQFLWTLGQFERQFSSVSF